MTAAGSFLYCFPVSIKEFGGFFGDRFFGVKEGGENSAFDLFFADIKKFLGFPGVATDNRAGDPEFAGLADYQSGFGEITGAKMTSGFLDLILVNWAEKSWSPVL